MVKSGECNFTIKLRQEDRDNLEELRKSFREKTKAKTIHRAIAISYELLNYCDECGYVTIRHHGEITRLLVRV